MLASSKAGLRTLAMAVAMMMLGLGGPALASESVADFYRGKTLVMLVGFPPGGLNDLGARIVARYMAKNLPGNPSQVVQNMPGAGGLTSTNYLYNVAPKDGTYVAGILRSIPQSASLDRANVRFEVDKFNWLGSTSSFGDDAYSLTIMANRPITSWQDIKGGAKRVRLGAVGPDSKVLFAKFCRDIMGLNVDITQGYPGAGQIFLAMQGGEIDGVFNGIASTRAVQKTLWNEKQFRVLIQFGRMTRHPDLPDVPTARELFTNAEDLALLEFLEAPFYMSLPFAAPPGIPADRAAALREAFDKAHKDPEFIAEATRAELDVSPINGEAVAKLVSALNNTPPAVVERYRKISAPN